MGAPPDGLLGSREPTAWSRYVRDITARARQREIAATSGIEASVLSRWLSGTVRPRAEHVIQFARAYRRPPCEALVAAGYLEPHEVEVVIPKPISELSAEELADEIEHIDVLRQRTAA